MDIKKNINVDLNRSGNRLGLFSVGGVFAAALMLCYLEYTTFNLSPNLSPEKGEVMIEGSEGVLIAGPIAPPPPPPPPAPSDTVIAADSSMDESQLAIGSEFINWDSISIGDHDDDDDVVVDDVIYDFVEVSPEFPGGIEEMYKFLSENIVYPGAALQNGIQGKVWVQFIVGTDGNIEDVVIAKGKHRTLDKEAKRVVESMPKWSPGMQLDKAVKARYTLPINFTIN